MKTTSMGELGPVGRLREELREKDAEVERLRGELAESDETKNRALVSRGDMRRRLYDALDSLKDARAGMQALRAERDEARDKAAAIEREMNHYIEGQHTEMATKETLRARVKELEEAARAAMNNHGFKPLYDALNRPQAYCTSGPRPLQPGDMVEPIDVGGPRDPRTLGVVTDIVGDQVRIDWRPGGGDLAVGECFETLDPNRVKRASATEADRQEKPWAAPGRRQ